MQTLSTRFTRLLGIAHPVMQEGLGPYRTVHLAAAVSNAGGLGTVSIPGISEEPAAGAAKLRGYIEEACALSGLVHVAEFVPGIVQDALAAMDGLQALRR